MLLSGPKKARESFSADQARRKFLIRSCQAAGHSCRITLTAARHSSRHRQIARLLAFENPGGQAAGLAIVLVGAAAICDQAAILRIFAGVIDRRQPVPIRLRDKLIAPGVEEGIVGDEQCIGALLGDARKSGRAGELPVRVSRPLQR